MHRQVASHELTCLVFFESLNRNSLQTAFKILFVLSVAISLTLSPSMGQVKNRPCDGSATCADETVVDCAEISGCEGYPPPGDCCSHEEYPAEQEPHHDEDGEDCPAGPHEHHHHHQCVHVTTLWLIVSPAESLIQPHGMGSLNGVSRFLWPPEPPVFLLKRPPIA